MQTRIISTALKQSGPALHTDHSPFLNLPGELRNAIYELVLHEPDGLQYVDCASNKPILKTRDRPATSSNQLKFVNRQLYQETPGLELLHNVVALVPDSASSTAGEQFLSFTSTLSVRKSIWLTRVTLYDDPTPADRVAIPESLEMMHSINEYRIVHLGCKLDYIFRGHSENESPDFAPFYAVYSFFRHAIVLSRAFKNRRAIDAPSPSKLRVLEMLAVRVAED
jgi:hypothetical protein